jgi:anti-sigma B factor antagonist
MQIEKVGNIQVITLPERLDAVGVAGVEQKLSDAVLLHGGKTLVDMAHVNFVASLALRMLLTNLKAVQAKDGGDLRLSGLQPQIAEVFRKSRFDSLFRIYADRDSALADY